MVVVEPSEYPAIALAFKRGAPCAFASARGQLGHGVPVISVDFLGGYSSRANIFRDDLDPGFRRL